MPGDTQKKFLLGPHSPALFEWRGGKADVGESFDGDNFFLNYSISKMKIT